MNTCLKIIICTTGVSLSLLISECKSPTQQIETISAAQVDTIAKADTSKIAPAPPAASLTSHIPLTLVIRNLTSPSAPVIVGLYGIKNKFPDPNDQLKEYHFTPNAMELNAKITDMQFGVYAVAIYQDVNNNGKIDKNIMGIPTEPYAFSNNYHPKVKAPGFDNCKFDYDSIKNTITVDMIK